MASNLSQLSNILDPGAFGISDTAAIWVTIISTLIYVGPATYSLFYIWRENLREDRVESNGLPKLKSKFFREEKESKELGRAA